MPTGLHTKTAVVTGANGFIGRWLISELTADGVAVTALVRRPEDRAEELREWVASHGGNADLLETSALDLSASDLGLEQAGIDAIEEAEAIYHLAALFGFGLSVRDARACNVTATETLIEHASKNANLERFIHISGYRTEGSEARTLDIDDERALARFYESHGAYETSKIEAHERARRAATRHGVPLTRVSPAIVIGDSRTGETTQMTGLAEVIQAMWARELPVMAGTSETWMPVIAVDVLAKLLAAIPTDPDSVNAHIVVFDEHTPTLPELLEQAAKRMDVDAPRRTISVGVLARLPKALTNLDREALSFISDDRYDPMPMRALCARIGIELPPVQACLDRWVDHLLDTRFLERAPRGGHHVEVGGSRVFVRGDVRDDNLDAVFLHGLLLNEQSWSAITDHLQAPFIAPDLPGLGRSAPGGGTRSEWMTSLLAKSATQPRLVAHSLGTAFALEYALAHPERVRELVLVSPFFLQSKPGMLARQPWLMCAALRRIGSARFGQLVGGDVDASLTEDAYDLLRRPSVASHTARWLAWASRDEVREELARALHEVEVPVTLIVGEHDRLEREVPARCRVIEIGGASHYPQLTHPAELIEALR